MTSLGNNEVIARNIRYYISMIGITDKEFARRVGYPYTTVRDWINAKTYPRIDKIERMAEFFGIQKSDLVEVREQPPTGNKKYLLDKIDHMTDAQIAKLNRIADVLKMEDENNL